MTLPPIRTVEVSRILDSIEGATIVSGSLDVECEGLSLVLQDGRVLIFTGNFVMGLSRFDTEKLH